MWDELGGVLHSGTVFGAPFMEGERLLRKLPPGDAYKVPRRHSQCAKQALGHQHNCPGQPLNGLRA